MEKKKVYRLTFEGLDGKLIVTGLDDLMAEIRGEIEGLSFTHGSGESQTEEGTEFSVDVLWMTQEEIDALPEYLM